MEVMHEDGGEGSMQCASHPYKNSTPGGICAFCLQEKLGKLVSSSYAAAVFPSSSSSSSPSFRSTYAAADGRATSSASSQNGGNDCSYNGHHHSRKSRLPFVSIHKKKKDERSSDIVFKRSKSTATPRRGIHFFDEKYVEDFSPNRRRFWSFLYLSKQSTARRSEKHVKNFNFSTPSNVGASSLNSNNGGSTRSSERERKREDFMAVDESGDEATFDRKVSRSRSVGCGSRSFSGDFFERISTGFGDCTLRRVESQREGKVKVQSLSCKNGGERGEDCIRQRVRCGGIFGGFVLSSSSSSNLIASNVSGHLSHGRSKSWSWAFASPMRAFGKNSAVKRDAASSKNAAPNLAAIPSLLAVGG